MIWPVMVEAPRLAQAELEPNTTCWPGCQRTQPAENPQKLSGILLYYFHQEPHWNVPELEMERYLIIYLEARRACLLLHLLTCWMFFSFFLFFGLYISFPSLVNANANIFILKHPTMPEKDSESVCTSILFMCTEFSNSGSHSLLILTVIISWNLHILLISISFLQVFPAE